jgi:AraC family transcriptional regulator
MIDQKTAASKNGMRTDYLACIQKSIDYIEDNLKSGITLNECARTAGFSVYHYYRVFEAYLGIPVMEYARKRRLAWALTDLQKGLRIIDVAMDYGFGSERSFSRAFKKEYGISPGKYRSPKDFARVPAKLILKSFQENNIIGGVIMEPKIIKKPAFKVAGFELKTTNIGGVNLKEVPKFWDRYFAENWATVLHEQLKPVNRAELGLCFPGGLEEGEFCYVIGVEVADFQNIPEGMFKGQVPEATYAVFTTPPVGNKGDEFSKDVQGTWDYILKSWFPKSGYEFDDKSRIDFEHYYEKSQGDHDIQADIYVPIVKKQ